jgi:hypothetical protein
MPFLLVLQANIQKQYKKTKSINLVAHLGFP